MEKRAVSDLPIKFQIKVYQVGTFEVDRVLRLMTFPRPNRLSFETETKKYHSFPSETELFDPLTLGQQPTQFSLHCLLSLASIIPATCEPKYRNMQN